MDIKNLGCINSYTGLLTSKKVTNVENRRELCKFMCNLALVRPVSLEDLMGGMGKSLNLAEKTSINKLNNSIELAQGAKVTVEGGFVLTVGEEIVEISGGNLYDRKASEKASALIMPLRNAGGTANIVAFSTPEYQKWTENVSRVMSYFGILPPQMFGKAVSNILANAVAYTESGRTTGDEIYNSFITISFLFHIRFIMVPHWGVRYQRQKE